MDNKATATRLAEIKASVIAAAHKTEGTANEQVRALGLAVKELIELMESALKTPTPDAVKASSDPSVAVPGAGVGNAAQKADVLVSNPAGQTALVPADICEKEIAPVPPVQKAAAAAIPVTQPAKLATEPAK